MRLRPSTRDEGMSLVELMVSMVIFGIAATAIASGFIAAIKTSGNDRGRLAGNNLAQREVEIVRNAFTANESGPQYVIDMIGSAENPSPLPGGTVGKPLVVDGRPYTVKRTVAWLPTDVGQSPCDGTAGAKYAKLALIVTVTWPSMNTKPVQTNTVLTPPKSVLQSNLSWVAVKITKANGQPNEGRTVYLKNVATSAVSDAVTASDGCAVFGTASTGAHKVYLNETDFVDIAGNQYTERDISIATGAQGTFQRLDISYDKGATLVARLMTETGYAIPAGVANIYIANTGMSPAKKSFPATSAAPITIKNLWPATDGYGTWGGSCDQSDPALWGGRAVATKIGPGGTSDEVPVRLAPLDLTVKNAANTILPNAEVLAIPWTTTGCSATEKPALSLGVADSNGRLKTSVPAGKWDLAVKNRTEPSGAGWTVITVNYNATPVTTNVVF